MISRVAVSVGRGAARWTTNLRLPNLTTLQQPGLTLSQLPQNHCMLSSGVAKTQSKLELSATGCCTASKSSTIKQGQVILMTVTQTDDDLTGVAGKYTSACKGVYRCLHFRLQRS